MQRPPDVKLFPMIVMMAAVAGCSPTPVVEDVGADACGASRLAGFVGQTAAALDGQYLPEVTRLLRPGTAVTEDFSATRLNVMLDGADVITGFSCG